MSCHEQLKHVNAYLQVASQKFFYSHNFELRIAKPMRIRII